MRVVVTRPLPAATRTGGRLAAMGHTPVLLPLTEARHMPEQAVAALARPHSALIFTSAEAIRAVQATGQPLPADTLVYAVGPSTAAAASAAGFTSVRSGHSTGSDLSALIATEHPTAALPLLYLAGRPRSAGLEEGLVRSRLTFAAVDVYEMTPIDHAAKDIRHALLVPPADAVLLYSREAARLFCSQAADILEKSPHFRLLCMSANVAGAIPQSWRQNIATAQRPDEDGMLALL